MASTQIEQAIEAAGLSNIEGLAAALGDARRGASWGRLLAASASGGGPREIGSARGEATATAARDSADRGSGMVVSEQPRADWSPGERIWDRN